MELEELAESHRFAADWLDDRSGCLVDDPVGGWGGDSQDAVCDLDPAPAWVDAYEI